VPDCRGHAPHLAIPAFLQFHFQPAVRDVLAHPDRRIAGPQFRCGREKLRPRRAGAPVAQVDAPAQRLQRPFVGHALDLRPIGFPETVTRIAEARLQRPMVGEQQQALAVVIEPAGRINARNADKITQRGASRYGRELAQHLERLVEQQQAPTGCGLLWHHGVNRRELHIEPTSYPWR
jgi:hypothetical protein